MSTESVVYGCIKDSAYNDFSERRRNNRKAMLALPSAESWAVLNREMFSVPSEVSLDASLHTEVMHFGASYKGIECEWKHWLAEFEALLRNMYWVSATVHLETEGSGTHSFTFETNREQYIPGESDIIIRCEWLNEQWVGR